MLHTDDLPVNSVFVIVKKWKTNKNIGEIHNFTAGLINYVIIRNKKKQKICNVNYNKWEILVFSHFEKDFIVYIYLK